MDLAITPVIKFSAFSGVTITTEINHPFVPFLRSDGKRGSRSAFISLLGSFSLGDKNAPSLFFFFFDFVL